MVHKEDEQILLCSDCFKDEGLKLNAEKIGIKDNLVCPNCGSYNGKKLPFDLVLKLVHQFFVTGTFIRTEYGGAPLIRFNEHHYQNDGIEIPEQLIDDIRLIQEAGKIGFFYYGPHLWMLGEVGPLQSLHKEEESIFVIQRILNEYPSRTLSVDEAMYRLRVNPGFPAKNNEYDTAPQEFLGKGRFDSDDLPVLYASQDLDVCIHECRTTVDDNLYVAKLTPSQNLKLLDLSGILDEETSESESLDMAVHMLFLAGKQSYEICRKLAKEAFRQGFDGIIYPSYFSLVRTGAMPFETLYGISIRTLREFKSAAKAQIIPNVALFGRPLMEGKVKVNCINRVILNKVIYDLSFGPVIQ